MIRTTTTPYDDIITTMTTTRLWQYGDNNIARIKTILDL